MFQLEFINQGKTYAFAGGTLAQACADAGYPLNLVCGGKGTCGKCKVRVEENGQSRWVLACKTEVDRDLTVFLTEQDLSRNASIITQGRSVHQAALAPMVSKRCLTRAALMPDHCGAWLSGAGLEVLRQFSALAADQSVSEMTFTYYGERLLRVEAGDSTHRLYGGAVDIGTTSVVLYAYDLVTGELLYTASALNGQISHGADVISRIMYSGESPAALEELSGAIRATLSGLLARTEAEIHGFCADLAHLVLCGNSTMQHLFFGLDPAGLGFDPFVNVTADGVLAPGAAVGLPMAPGGQVEFLPLLGGFVGADTASVLLTLPEDCRRYLMVDLGTNGEIGVGNHLGYRVASTACGPALEGGNIACGMRGTDGAIEKIAIEGDEVRIQVIGGGAPEGICGSAIIDAVAELLRVGLIDGTGLLLGSEAFAGAHPESKLQTRLFEAGEYNNAFLIAEGKEKIYISQHDIRQIQLAKSSICSGCCTLLEEAGLGLDDVDELLLAGAFGSYIDIDHALSIGLLPAVAREKISSIGNGAGKGVQLCLLDRAYLAKSRALPACTEHVELAASPSFMEKYITNMNFGGTEL